MPYVKFSFNLHNRIQHLVEALEACFISSGCLSLFDCFSILSLCSQVNIYNFFHPELKSELSKNRSFLVDYNLKIFRKKIRSLVVHPLFWISFGNLAFSSLSMSSARVLGGHQGTFAGGCASQELPHKCRLVFLLASSTSQ